MKRTSQKQSGFTIIELLIATTIFSLVLLMATAGVIELTRMYYRGVISARTQEAARVIIDEVAESIRYGTDSVTDLASLKTGPIINPPAADSTGHFCIGSRRYTAAIDKRVIRTSPDVNLKEQKHALWVEDLAAGCLAPPANYLSTDPADGRSLLPEGMRLSRFAVTEVVPDSVYQVDIGVAYGGTDLLAGFGDYAQCQPGPASEFCATSNLSVTVTKRL